MCLVGEAVLKGAATPLKCFNNPRRYDHSTEWRVTARNSLPDQNNVWLNVPMLDGEGFSGATHAAHDFVGDEQNPAAPANFRNAHRIAIGGNSGTESRAHDRFED